MLLNWTLELWEGAEGGQIWVRGMVGGLLLCAARDTLRRAEFRALSKHLLGLRPPHGNDVAHANPWSFRYDRGQQPGSELNLGVSHGLPLSK